MTLRRRHLLIASLLGVVATAAFAVTSYALEPTIEAVSSPTLAWSPSSADVSAGGSVAFKNASSISHGVTWTGGPETPSCMSVPINKGETNWAGSCTFAQAGIYTFRCSVHASMTGTITVGSAPGAPVVSTGPGTATSDTEATLSGSVDPEGQATSYFFNYGITAKYGLNTEEESAGAGTTSVPEAAPVAGLSAGTTYHFQIVAKNSSGTTPGSDQTFTTPGPPLVTTGQAAAVSDTEATLQGTVNPSGHETTYFFKYGATEAYGQATSPKSAGKGTTSASVAAPLTGLSPGTTYHFRLVAENSSGTTPGADRTLTTSSSPPPPEPPLTTTPVITPPPAEEGSPLGPSVAVAAGRHGSPLRVSVQILPSGAGGRLEVDLLVKGGSPKHAIAGRLVRTGVPSGKASLSVALNARAKRALRRKHRLALIVKIELTPPAGGSVVATRSVVLRA